MNRKQENERMTEAENSKSELVFRQLRKCDSALSGVNATPELINLAIKRNQQESASTEWEALLRELRETDARCTIVNVPSERRKLVVPQTEQDLEKATWKAKFREMRQNYSRHRDVNTLSQGSQLRNKNNQHLMMSENTKWEARQLTETDNCETSVKATPEARKVVVKRNEHSMPQAYAERKQKYIKKLKEQGKFEMFKKKKAEQEKARRARMKESLNALSKVKREKWMLENRIKTRISVHKCRQRKKLNQLQEITGDRSIFNRNQPVIPKPAKVMHSYKTKSALAKATTKTKKSLPSSPSKRKAVVSNVLNSFSAKDKDEIIGNTNRKKTIERGLSSAWVREIQKFYERNDISRMSPNVKDCRKFVNAETGEKEHKQIRHLMYNLDKVYEFFDKEFRGENNGNDPVMVVIL